MFWAATASGVAAGLLCAIVALRIGLMVVDRQIALPDWTAEIWYHVGNVSDTAAFVVLYVITPLVWIGLSAWWWLSRTRARRRGRAMVMVLALVIASLPGVWAWFVTALWQVERVFELDAMSRDLIYARFADTNHWGVAVVVGLAWALALVLGDTLAMARTAVP